MTTPRHIEQQLVDDLKVVLQQAEDLLESTTGASGKGLDKAREKLSASMDLLRQRWNQLSEGAADAARATGRVVRDHPVGATGSGLALLAALIGGFWLWQRLR
ncbi:MAG: DUF883 domain-containing protein [Verrucomicrobia bacterium]|jgi:ElaB/YqjD/DUF883 family membrane-anchored ribosome-binding protein|nr:DUF883 domain-containing protein [Verrucomicrobiota bacterium]